MDPPLLFLAIAIPVDVMLQFQSARIWECMSLNEHRLKSRYPEHRGRGGGNCGCVALWLRSGEDVVLGVLECMSYTQL